MRDLPIRRTAHSMSAVAISLLLAAPGGAQTMSPLGHAIRGIDVSLDICRSTFSGNRHGSFGRGAVGVRDSDLSLRDCVFIANSSGGMPPDDPTGAGGAVYVENGSAMIVSCLMNRNRAADGGEVYAAGTASVGLVNCTLLGIEEVSVLNPLEVAFAEAGASLTLHNVIVRSSGTTALGGAGAIAASFSNVESGWPGPGNIDEDPLFVDPNGLDGIAGTSDDDLRLGPGSPCIDAGDNDALPGDIVLDLAGKPRRADDPDTPDSGNGQPPVVDMGAYEYQPSCAADLDGDGDVRVEDLLIVLGAWGTPDADITGDGTTDSDDVLAVFSGWGPCL